MKKKALKRASYLLETAKVSSHINSPDFQMPIHNHFAVQEPSTQRTFYKPNASEFQRVPPIEIARNPSNTTKSMKEETFKGFEEAEVKSTSVS